ncbi:succinate dehydrogenase assembly factor 2 [Qipengyuania sediminis]|uniref:FAD assembly factor SdhE n=1 Tax=Qipengyuania sediminis TaxID=1532023 RepID=UPI00105960F9|nr:succinate dehydrogenase assembly factor 2 [Qipengyuania sediminis]
MTPPDRQHRLSRARFRAWHRGTREADYVFGGYFDRFHESWDEAELAWFEAVLEEDDADVLGWVMGWAEVPERFAGTQIEAMRRLDYVATEPRSSALT